MAKLFKNKYYIGIYENSEGETLIGLFDNPQQLADYLNTSLNIARSMVSHVLKGDQKCIMANEKKVKLAIIDMTEED